MSLIKFTPIVLSVACGIGLAHAGTVQLKGRLIERGTRKPLAEMSVYVLPQKLKTTTDDKGEFTIEGVEEGKFTWVVNAAGYLKLEEFDVTDVEDAKEFRTLYLERDSYQVFETTIYGKEEKRNYTARSLRREDFLKAPGSAGDPIRAVQNLPGVNRPQSFSSQVIIQGSGPQDTKYLLNDHNVPIVFHFGGLSSILIPEAVDRVDLFTAGYGPEYGRANGGLIGIWTRSPRKDRIHGVGFADTINAGALLEGPAGPKDREGGFMVGIRQSYIGTILGTVLKNNESFNLTVAPKYSDALALYETKLTERDDFRLTAFGSQDSLEFLLKEPVKQDPAIRGTFETSTAFFRLLPSVTHRHSNSTSTKWSLGMGRDWLKINSPENYFRIRTFQTTARGELDQTIFPQWKHNLGFDNQYLWADVDINLPSFYTAGGVQNPLSVGTRRQSTVFSRDTVVGFYWRNEIRPYDEPADTRGWVFMPNIRIDRFKRTQEWLPQPRPAIRYQFDEWFGVRTSGGLYYQQPQPGEDDPVFGNPEIKSPRAWHANIGIDRDFRQGNSNGFNVSTDFFYKKLEKRIMPSAKLVSRNGTLSPENYNNNGSGNVFGAQSQIRFNANPLSMSLIYTLSRARRTEPGRADYPSPYDQTHLIGLLSAVELPRNWTISARFRYSTGNPTTPITGGIFDADNDVYLPVRGAFFSERLPAFYQLDVRFDKKWIFDGWILSAYLDILNATNRANQESIVYAYDYSRTQTVRGLPILPTIGLKGEF